MTKFRGENQIVKFRRIAENLASKISSYEGVSGIVLLGGLARDDRTAHSRKAPSTTVWTTV